MTCSRCGTATRPGQKFCAECGLTLTTACPNCGTPYEGSPKFCAECGHALLAPTQPTTAFPGASPLAAQPATPAAERRFVTVLFADLVGFTSLSEEQDAEDVRDLLSRYFEVARGTIEGYGGTVEKFIGDAVMAVWGAPVAQEDDPERAVRAGLELVERVQALKLGQLALDVRVGILSGEAAVTPGRTGEGMVAGDLVNTASRLESVAPGGVVLVGEATQRATSAAIAYEPAGDQLLKGKQAPVAAWRALRVVARVGGQGREEGLEPPFVGREEEFRLLKDQLHTAERANKLHVATITGQPGVGKSRLVWELEKYLDGLAGPKLYYWHQGRSPAYGEGVTFWALGEMVRRRARIAEGEDSESTRQKLRATLADFVPDDVERQWLEPALGALLGIDEVDWSEREQLFSAWRTFLERVADRGPTVFVFEDIQWADTGLLDFIEHVLERTRNRPILVVTLARPEFIERRPNFGIGRHAFAALHLDPLSDEAMAALLRGLIPTLGDADLARIVERAEGVPLYAVETVRSLVDGGYVVRKADTYEIVKPLPVLDVPPTLRALIASRLDALEPGDRALVQDAAVLGQVFAAAALTAFSARTEQDVVERLRALSAKEIVGLETDPRSPERGQYRFTQGLIREVAYGTLSKRERRGKHVAAARYFEQIGDEELAAVLANHYLEAYEAAPEGNEGAAVAAQARVALRAAADRAARLHSHAQALAYYEKAIAVTFDDADLAELRSRAAGSASNMGDIETARTHLGAVLAWQEARNDPIGVAHAAAQLGGVLFQASLVDEAEELLERALENLPSTSDPTAARIHGQLARVHLLRDQGQPALDSLERALDVAEVAGDRRLVTQLLISKGWAVSILRRPMESEALMLGALELARLEGDPGAQSRALFNLSGFTFLDDPRRALRYGREGMELDERHGLVVRATGFAGNIASIALLMGDLDGAIDVADKAAEVETPIALAVHGYGGAAHALRGNFDEAEKRIDIVRKGVVGSSSRQDLSPLGNQEALLAFARGDLAAARRRARETRDAYSAADAPMTAVLAARCSLLLRDLEGVLADRPFLNDNRIYGAWLDRCLREADAGIMALEGRTSEARTTYRQIVDEWRSKDLPMDLAMTLLHRAVLLGDSDLEAAAGREEARRIFESMGAADLLDRVERGISATPVTRTPRAPAETAAAATR